MATRKQNESDFTLMAGAFKADEKMAAQVCRLLVEKTVTQDEARMMLGLIGEGQLRSEMNWTYYPIYNPSPSPNQTITWDGTNTTIYAMAENVVGLN